MSNFLNKDNSLPSGKYTITLKGFTRIGCASKESGFDKKSDVFAAKLEQEEVLFDSVHKCHITIKNNATNEEMNFTAICDRNLGVLYSEIPLATTFDNSDFEDTALGSEIELNRIVTKKYLDDYDIESLEINKDEFYFEEYCPNGTLEETFEIDHNMDLLDISFTFYEVEEEYCSCEDSSTEFFQLYFPKIGTLSKIATKGSKVRRFFWIDGEEVDEDDDKPEIKKYLGGKSATISDASWSEEFDGFIIKNGVLTAYKGYSDKIEIPLRVTEIADNVFLFPVESIKLPNKNIKVGLNFPWDKVL